jgi:hypothetical protein
MNSVRHPNRASAVLALLLGASLSCAMLHAQVAAVNVTVGATGALIPANFTGYSLELENNGFLGNSTSPNTVFYQSMKNLGPGVLRMGGNSSDRWCWTAPPQPGLCTGSILTSTDIANYFFAASQTNWKVLMGNNLGQNSPSWSLTEVVNGIAANSTPSQVLGLEIGNEPDDYVNDGLRNAANYPNNTYTPANHATEFLAYANAYKGDASAKVYPLVGSAAADIWRSQANIGTFISTVGANNLGFVSVHDYPLSVCGSGTITASALLAKGVTGTLAAVAPVWVQTAKNNGLSLRFSETNSATCGGQNGVSNTFAETLWALDWMFTGAKIGLSGMNFHNGGLPGANYAFMQTTVTQSGANFTYTNTVKPLYYALYMFAREAQNQFMLPASITTSSNITAWATTACSACAVKVFLINKDANASGTVNVTLSAPMGNASLLSLTAPAISSTESEISYGGTQFNNATGLFGATQTSSVLPSGDEYSFTLPNVAIAELVIPAVAPDAYVRDGSFSGDTFGSSTILDVKHVTGSNTGFERRAFLKFDLTGISKTGSFSSAKLQMFGNSLLTSGTTPISAFTVADTSWTESAIDWTNQPALGTSITTTNIGTTAQYWTWDVTSWIQSQVANGATEATIALVMPTTGAQGVQFNSREAGTNPPLLIVNP